MVSNARGATRASFEGGARAARQGQRTEADGHRDQGQLLRGDLWHFLRQIGRSGDGGGALMGRSASGAHRQSDASATRKSKA